MVEASDVGLWPGRQDRTAVVHPESEGEIYGPRWIFDALETFSRGLQESLAVRGQAANCPSCSVKLTQWGGGVLAKKVSGAHNGANGSTLRLSSNRIYEALIETEEPSIIVADMEEQSVKILSITCKDFDPWEKWNRTTRQGHLRAPKHRLRWHREMVI
jgi:hypothetical protein